jgi:uncharacterized protein (TIGR03382 family)
VQTDHHSHRSWWRVLLAVSALAAIVVVLDGLLFELSFEPTDAARFRSQIAQTQITGGMIGLAAVVVAAAVWLVARRRRRLRPVTAALCVLALASSVAGAAVRAARSHPEGEWARALSRIVLPAGYTDMGVGVAHASSLSAPDAARRWTTSFGRDQACADVHTALVSWADRASVSDVRVGKAFCFVSARWHGHQVATDVTVEHAETSVAVLLTP